MLPFGKQQESLNLLSTTNPEELPGNRWDTVHLKTAQFDF
jgi:hypothetical protein